MSVNPHNLDIKSENVASWSETDTLETQPSCNSTSGNKEQCCSESKSNHKTVLANLNIKEEFIEIPDEKVNEGKVPDNPKLEQVIVSKIKEEIKNEFIVSTYKNVNAGLFVDPLKPIEVIDIKTKEEIKDDPGTIASAVDIEGMVQVKIKLKKEEIDNNPTSNYIKCPTIPKKRKRIAEYQCHICLHSTIGKDSLARHKEQMHTKKEEKPYIKPPLSSFQASFEEHIKQRKIGTGPKETTNPKRFKCSQCNFQTESQYVFSKHSPQDNHVYRCNSCNFICSNYCELNQHTLKHKNEKSSEPNKIENVEHFQCLQCSYKTFDERFIKEHVTLHKASPPVKWAECAHCPYKTSYKHGLRFHSRLHEDQQSPKDEPRSPKFENLDCSNEDQQSSKEEEQESPKHELFDSPNDGQQSPKEEEGESSKHEDFDSSNKYRLIKTEFLEAEDTSERSESKDLLRNLLLGQSTYLEGK